MRTRRKCGRDRTQFDPGSGPSADTALHGFNSGSKNYSVVGGAIRDVTTGTYDGISVDGTVKSLCGLGLF